VSLLGKGRVLARLGRVREMSKGRVPREESMSWQAEGMGRSCVSARLGGWEGETLGEIAPGAGG
jgi:hypothetical protein